MNTTQAQQLSDIFTKLVISSEQLEKRSDQVNLRSNQATQALLGAKTAMSEHAADIEARLQNMSATTMSNAFEKPMQEFDREAQRIANYLNAAASTLQTNHLSLGKLMNAVLWKVLAIIGLATILACGAIWFVYAGAEQKIKRTEWISEINAAMDKGKLIACPDQGICAVVDKKSVRLDK
jgi:hypothetical protein